MSRHLAIVASIATGLVWAAEAQAQPEADFGLWNALFFTGQTAADTPAPTFWFDAHARREDAGTVVILRPGVGLAFAPWGSLWLGYAWIPAWVDESNERLDEHRVWEQLILSHRFDVGLSMQSRTRLEQRFLVRGDRTAHRFREFVRLNYRPRESVPVGIAFWDEVFVGIQGADWAKQGFDQNRAFLGLAIHAVEKLFRIEVGYLNVFVSRQTNRLVHVLSINLFVSFKGRQ